MGKMKKCASCGAEIATSAKTCPQCGAKNKKPIFKKWWFWVIIVIVLGSAAMGGSGSDEQASEESKVTEENTEVNETENDDNVPTEYKSALKKAESYSEKMHMSKAGIYDQLTSEYGEQFTAEEAQYAIDNIEADWNANALAKAKEYQENMDMSPAAIHDQLTSEYGEQFTVEEADYAIANLD